MTWNYETLGEVIKKENGLIQTGPFGSQLKQSEYTQLGIPVVMPTDIRDGDIDTSKIARVPEAKANQLARHKLRPESIVLPRRGAITKRAYVRPDQEGWLCGTGCLKIEPTGSILWPKFLYYLMGTADSIDWLERNAVGSTMPNLSAEIVARFPIRYPEIDKQKKIAFLLSRYDDLIANNFRRVELLERSARLLFDEWFVRFRYPGHEHTRLVSGVPEGWQKKTLAELCESVDYGYTASATEECVGPKYLRITDIVPPVIGWATVPYCAIDEVKKIKFSLNEGDIVIARTGATVGYAKRLHKKHPDSVFASYLVRLRLKQEVDNLLVGTFVESDSYKNFVRSRIGGAAQPNANAKVLASAEMLIPPSALQTAYREFVDPLLDQRELLGLQNARLTRARDLLLPRLMDGRIEV